MRTNEWSTTVIKESKAATWREVREEEVMSGGARKSGGHGFNTDPTLHTQHSKGLACSHAEQAHAQDILMLHKMHYKNILHLRVCDHRHNLDMHYVWLCHRSRAGEHVLLRHIGPSNTASVAPTKQGHGLECPQGGAFAFNVGNLGSIPSFHRSP